MAIDPKLMQQYQNLQNQTQTQGNYVGGIGQGLQASWSDGYASAPEPPPPNWSQIASLQQTIMALQNQIFQLQERLTRLQNTKDWLVGPEGAGPDAKL